MKRALLVLAVGGASLAWQFATVQVNYGGNWSALFCTSGRRPLPQLAGEKLHTFPESNGFDGQFYHYIAHEPVPGKLQLYIDAPRMRYRRILVPGLAWLLALGPPHRVDLAYMIVGYVFLLLGVWWMAGWARDAGLPEYWGLLFAALPASLVFIDRLTIDHALAALAVAFAVQARRSPSWWLYSILVLAPLARETGLLLTAAWCGHRLLVKRRREALLGVATALPWFAWSLYVAHLTPPSDTPVSPIPLSRLAHYLTHPPAYPPDLPFARLISAADLLALAGMLAVIGLAVILACRNRRDPVALAALGFALLAAVLQWDEVWASAYNYGRIFSPLLALAAIGWMLVNRAAALLPLLMVLPRVLMQFGRQAEGVLRALAGS